MNGKIAAVLTALVLAPTASFAASVSITGYTGTHFHKGGNTGPAYLMTTDLNRTDDIPIAPSGLVIGTAADAYAGPIPNVAGVRVGRTKTSSATIGLVQTDGFFFRSVVETEAECTQKEGVSFGCSPFMGNQASVSFNFSVDADSTMFFDGTWLGGNGAQSPVSVVDFLALRVRQDNGFGGFLVPYNVDTNGPNRNQPNGVFGGSISLLAGETYIFDFSHRAHAQAPDAEGVVISDASVINFAASIIEANADVAAFEGRFNAAAAAVPLPAAGWMLLAGVGAMGAMRRKRV